MFLQYRPDPGSKQEKAQFRMLTVIFWLQLVTGSAFAVGSRSYATSMEPAFQFCSCGAPPLVTFPSGIGAVRASCVLNLATRVLLGTVGLARSIRTGRCEKGQVYAGPTIEIDARRDLLLLSPHIRRLPFAVTCCGCIYLLRDHPGKHGGASITNSIGCVSDVTRACA